MKKQNADIVKTKFSIEHQYEDALAYLTLEELITTLNCLDGVQATLERQISDYALDLVHDLLDDETPQIVRTFWFSKGMADYYLCVDGRGLIRLVDDEMPEQLIDQVLGALMREYPGS